jgi:hypothetical protein
VKEFTTVSKPVSMKIFDKNLYILGAQSNQLQRINVDNGKVLDTINFANDGFSTGFNLIENSNLAVVTDIKKNTYTIIDLEKGKVLKTYSINVPVKDVVITNSTKLFD